MKLSVLHRTAYRYSGLVTENHNEVRLLPVPAPGQHVISARLHVEPPAYMDVYDDAFGNRVAYVNVHGPHDRLVIESRLLVETAGAGGAPERAPWPAAAELPPETREFLLPGRFTDPPLNGVYAAFLAETAGLDGYGQDAARWAAALARHLYSALRYVPGATDVHSTVAEVLAGRSGVCQDYAHLFCVLCRAGGLPARYVGGYLYQESGQHQNHAWAEVFLPGAGWVGLDPANGMAAGPAHVRVASGRDYADVPPLRGVFRGAARATMAVQLEIRDLEATRGHR